MDHTVITVGSHADRNLLTPTFPFPGYLGTDLLVSCLRPGASAQAFSGFLALLLCVGGGGWLGYWTAFVSDRANCTVDVGRLVEHTVLVAVSPVCGLCASGLVSDGLFWQTHFFF